MIHVDAPARQASTLSMTRRILAPKPVADENLAPDRGGDRHAIRALETLPVVNRCVMVGNRRRRGRFGRALLPPPPSPRFHPFGIVSFESFSHEPHDHFREVTARDLVREERAEPIELDSLVFRKVESQLPPVAL